MRALPMPFPKIKHSPDCQFPGETRFWEVENDKDHKYISHVKKGFFRRQDKALGKIMKGNRWQKI